MCGCSWCNLSEQEKKWLLTENESWSVYLADEQDCVGRCILLLKRHCASLSDLSDREWMDLKPMVNRLEHGLKAVLGAELCNWSCLLNSFYKSASPDPHLHLHVRPRYRTPVTLAGAEYPDEEFGHHYNPQKENQLGEAEFEILYQLLKESLFC